MQKFARLLLSPAKGALGRGGMDAAWYNDFLLETFLFQ
jgi:hypothetical protein